MTGQTTEQLRTEVLQLRQQVLELKELETSLARVQEALQVSNRCLEIANRHIQMAPLLQEVVAEIKTFTGCAAVGVRLLDEENNIFHQGHEGFSQQFYDLESPLSIKSDQCIYINVINGETDAKLPCYTTGGSFYLSSASRFRATLSETERKDTCNACNQAGYESVALVPIRFGDDILGLIYVADPREKMIPLEKVEVLENVGKQLGIALQRVRAEEERHQSTEAIEAVFNNIEDSISVIDATTFSILKVNQAFLKTSKRSERDVIGKHCHEVNHADSDDSCPLTETLKTGCHSCVEHIHYDKDGRKIYFEISTLPIRNDKGEIHQIIHIARDITARKRIEAALRQANDELERRVEGRTYQLSQANALLRREINERQRTADVLRITANNRDQASVRVRRSSSKRSSPHARSVRTTSQPCADVARHPEGRSGMGFRYARCGGRRFPGGI